MEVGLCSLCLQKKELLNKSHIIPNSFFKIGLQEEKEMFRTSNLEIKEGFENLKKIYSGEFESGILCHNCDNNILGKLDDYGYRVIFKGFKSKRNSIFIRNILNKQGFDYSIIYNVDYVKFKLFLLSVLWRSSISSRPFFSDVFLENDQEIIRQMLLNNNPGVNCDYPVLIHKPNLGNINLMSLIGQPRKFNFSNKPSYVFVINGLIFIFLITRDFIDSGISEYTINDKNQFRIIHLPPEKSMDYILRFINIK